MIPLNKSYCADIPLFNKHVQSAMDSGIFTVGENVKRLEELARGVVGSPVTAVSSCASGLEMALRLYCKPGGIVLIPAFTFEATLLAAVRAGMHPLFVDVHDNGLINWNSVKTILDLGVQVEAIMPVDIFGLTVPHPPFKVSDEIAIIRDSAQALGSEESRLPWWTCRVFSMSPTKVVTAGEGGLIQPSNAVDTLTFNELRNYGMSAIHHSSKIMAIHDVGMNARMSEINAAMGIANMTHANELVCQRRAVRRQYWDELFVVPRVVMFTAVNSEDSESNSNYIGVRVTDIPSQHIVQKLADRKIGSKSYYRPLLSDSKLLTKPSAGPVWHFPVSKLLSFETLAVPLFHTITEDEVTQVCDALKEIVNALP